MKVKAALLHPKHLHNKQPSFLLVELLVAISLFVLLITFAIPSFRFSSRHHVLQEIDELFSVCHLLQQRAMARSREYVLHLDPCGYHTPAEQGPPMVHHQFHKEITFGCRSDIKGPPGRPTKPVSKSVTFPTTKGQSRISFFPTGVMSAGTAYLTDAKQQHVAALTSGVAQVSYLRKYQYTPEGWRSW